MKKINAFLSLMLGIIILLNCIIPTVSIASIDIVKQRALVSSFKFIMDDSILKAGNENTVDPTQWVAVDGLGRTINTHDQVGDKKSNKEVGILFWLWHDTETVMYRRDREAMANATTQEEKQRAFNTFLHKEPINVQERLDAGATMDFNDDIWLRNNSDNQVNIGNKGYCWWNEPIYGYYTNSERNVLRRQIELLADAGVDFLLLDYSNTSGAPDGPDSSAVGSRQPYENNRFSYCWNWKPLFEALEEAKADGINVPKVAFMLSFTDQDKYIPEDEYGNTFPHQGKRGNNEMLLCLYENLYKLNKYSDLWYYRDGKPFIMSYKPDLTNSRNDSTVSSADKMMLNEINSFFTFRNPGTTDVNAISSTNQPHTDGWLWQSAFPQNYGKSGGEIEEVPVSAAQNLGFMNEPSSFGRNETGSSNSGQTNSNFTGDYTYRYRGKDVTVNSSTQNAVYYGRNFQQQWDRAIALDPEVIVITGWNEWVAVRQYGTNGRDPNKNYFLDEFNDEGSKDIEPTKGKLKDNYYYQMVTNIRRYKGVGKAPVQLKEKTIDINGSISQWNDNVTTYNHYITENESYKYRSATQWGCGVNSNLPSYINRTALMGNDLKTAKVSYDADYIYFYLEVENRFKDYGINKTRLLIDTVDSENSTSTKNWEEYEFILNRYGATDSKLRLEKSKGGWSWEYVGDVDYTKSTNTLQVKIPISYLELQGDTIKFNFKWADNNITGVTDGDRLGYDENLLLKPTANDVKTGDIMSVYNDGDAAPGGRFAFSFTGQKTYSINYDLKNGSYGTYHPTSANVGDIVRISNPKRDGYNFAGWTMTNGDTSTAMYGTSSTNVVTKWSDATTKVTSEYFKNLRSKFGQITLTANWTEKTAKLTYNANGHGTAPAVVTMRYSTATNAAAEIEVEGYIFKGWNTKADGSGTDYAAGSQVKAANVVPVAMTLYAKWTEKTAKLTYNANGHGTAPTAVTMRYSTATNAANEITGVTGYTFNGWNTKADGSGTKYAAGSQIKAVNVVPTAMTLYAIWKPVQYSITYNLNGGQIRNEVKTYNIESEDIKLPTPNRAGYTFLGWTGTGLSGIQREVTIKKGSTGNKSFSANWKANTYAITYNLENGTINENPTSYTAETSEIKINAPIREGYMFNGWTKIVTNLGWEDGYIFFETGEEGYSGTYPDSHCSGIIYLKKGVTYSISGCGDYNLSDIRWKLYDLNGVYLGSTQGNIIGGTCTPTQDCYAKILFYKNSTEEQRNGTVITGNGVENEVIIPSGSTGDIVLTASWTEGSYFNIKEYVEDNNYIKKIKPNTKRIDFEKNIETNINYTIKEGEIEVSKNDLIKTGQILKAGNKKYILVVSGDLSGDGLVTIKDLALTQRKILRSDTELTEAVIKAADKNDDGALSILDLAAIQRFILRGEGL